MNTEVILIQLFPTLAVLASLPLLPHGTRQSFPFGFNAHSSLPGLPSFLPVLSLTCLLTHFNTTHSVGISIVNPSKDCY